MIRPIALVVGLTLMVGSCMGGCSLSIMTISMFEPQSPIWNFTLGRADLSPSLHEGRYHVWVATHGQRCTLTVRRESGELIGADEGHNCSVFGDAKTGEHWKVESTLVPPSADVHGGISPDPKVKLPIGLKLAWGGCALLFVVSAMFPRRSRRTPG